MRFDELIGLLITVGAFIFMVIRGALKEKDAEEVEEEAPRPPPIKIRKKKHQESPSIYKEPKKPSMVSQHYLDLAKSTPYEVAGKSTPSAAHRLLGNLKSKKDMVILREIMGPPKGLQ